MRDNYCGVMLGILAITASSASADEHTEHVLVTAPLHKTAAETAMPVTVLKGEALEDKVANSIGETLQFEPGISSSSFGPGVGRPVIRGQTGPRAAVIQNGITIQDASAISPDHANATEPMLAESIEVIRGPATLLYGSGTIGGVVNVIDNRIPSQSPEGVEMGVEYRHNTVNDQNTSAVVLDAGSDKVALHFDGFYRDSNDVRIPGYAIDDPDTPPEHNTDGYIANSDSRGKAYTAGISFIDDWGYVGVSGSQLQDNYGLPPGGHDGHDHDDEHEEEHEEHEEDEHDDEHDETVRIDLDQRRFDVKTELYHPASRVEALRLHLVKNDYEHTELEGDEVGTKYRNDAINFRGEMVHHALAGFHGAFGIDYGARTFSAEGEEALVTKSDIRNAGLFLLEDFHTDKWTYEFGARLDHQSITPDDKSLPDTSHSAFSVSASALWSVTEHNNLSLSLSRAQRAPSIEELYSNVTNEASGEYVIHAATGAVEIGDVDLKTETSFNTELGWRHMSERFSVGANLYYNHIDDYIYQYNSGETFEDTDAPIYYYQQQTATFRGIELDMTVALLNRNGHEVDLDLFGDAVRATLDDTDEDVPRLPPARIGAQLNYKQSHWWTYVRAFHNMAQNNPGEDETPTDGYTRIDAAVYYKLPVADGLLTMFLKGNNLSNAEIRNSTSFLRDIAPEPGRGAEIGMRYAF